MGDRVNMVFAGTMVNRGRYRAVVCETGADTQRGEISAGAVARRMVKAPLLARMERFTCRIALAVAALAMAAVAFTHGMVLDEVFLLAVALAVAAISEGLPVVLTENRCAARKIGFARSAPWEVTGEALEPMGAIHARTGGPSPEEEEMLARLCQVAVLANEGYLAHRNGDWTTGGDAVDVALLVMAHKAGVVRAGTVNAMPEIAAIPFESERQFSASLNEDTDRAQALVKGALERLLPFCTSMQTTAGTVALDGAEIEAQAQARARDGYRVIAFVAGRTVLCERMDFCEAHLPGLTFIGLAGIIDPLRPEAKPAVSARRTAGIEVAMVTGDHPTTALTIAREMGLAHRTDQVVTRPQLKALDDEAEIDRLVAGAAVFARVEPQQKLDIVQSLQRSGYYVAVSGDGANDAPALRAAHVGVAMGQNGTDLAHKTAEIITTDDNFASTEAGIEAGIEEGRIACANVRKVIFLPISTRLPISSCSPLRSSPGCRCRCSRCSSWG